MKSRWSRSNSMARYLRRRGYSIRKIERRLKIPRSTLSYWLRDIRLSSKQEEKLLRARENGLIKARRKAALWSRNQKRKRLLEAKNYALEALKEINLNDKKVLELALAVLYLGEGTKKMTGTAIGSSDPLILKCFLSLVKILYDLGSKDIKCQLNLRADQNPKKMRRFWSRKLKLPLSCFGYVNLDKRTVGSKTYPSYKGVCHLLCGRADIQRRLMYLSELFCRKVTENHSGS